MPNLLIVRGHIFPESGQGIITGLSSILNDADVTAPVAPTVTPLSTEDTTPTVTGTWDSTDAGVTLTVTLDGTTYTLGTDPELTNVGDAWSLAVAVPLALGTYDVVATATDLALNSTSDATTDELVIFDATPPPVPTVNTTVATTATPTITGTFSEAESAELEVIVDSNIYTLTTDPELTNVGDNWTLVIPATAPLSDGVYTVSAVATDASGNSAASTSTNQLTVNLAACTQSCTTFRQLMNTVLENLSEDTIPDGQADLSTAYHKLIRNIINDVLTEVYAAHNWGSILTAVTAEVLATAKSATLRFGDNCAEADARLAYLPAPAHQYGQFIPQAFDVTDATDPYPLVERDMHWVRRQQTLFTSSGAKPVDFCLEPSGSTMTVRLTPVPSAARSLKFDMYVPQDRFVADATDFDNCVTLPRSAIVAVTIGATWQAMEERGEELGQNGRFTANKFKIALDSAIVQDDTAGTGDNNVMVVV